MSNHRGTPSPNVTVRRDAFMCEQPLEQVSLPDALFEVRQTSIEHLELRIVRPCSAKELAAQLFLSKAACKRAFARDALSPAARFEADETVRIPFERPAREAAATSEPVEVLWHDRFALAANKPAGVLVHSDGTGEPTLTEQVQGFLARKAQEEGWPFVPVAQAVNRLDVKTSGIVLFSLTKEFQPAFDALVTSHKNVRKCYLALVKGSVPKKAHTIDAPLARDRHDARRMRVGATGKPAQTRVACMERAHGTSLVACELLTGRKHQIRVHMAHAGHPIVGDDLYGRARPQDPLMLHAAALEFIHPVTGATIRLATDWPERFASLYAARVPDWSILLRT